MVRLTIVTIVYNGEKYIEKTLQSLAGQTRKDFEYVILDGGSSDKTLEIIARYRSVVTKVISRKDNGALDAFNKGWSDLSGDYIMLVSGDDWLEPCAVADILGAVEKNPAVDVVGFGMAFWKETAQGLVYESSLSEPDDGVFDIQNAVYGGCINHAIHRRFYEQYGLYDHARWKCFSDRELQLRFSLANPVKAVFPATLYHFRRHEESTTGHGRSDGTATSLYESALMAEAYAERANLTAVQRRQILDWYGFCWVRAGFFFLKTGQVRAALTLLVRGMRVHPLACLRKALRPSMPDVYKYRS